MNFTLIRFRVLIFSNMFVGPTPFSQLTIHPQQVANACLKIRLANVSKAGILKHHFW